MTISNIATAFNAFVTKVQNNFTFLKNKADTMEATLATKAAETDLTTHTGNTTVHITASEREAWNAKQNALTAQQLNNIAAVPNKLDTTTAATTYATKSELTAIADSRLQRVFVNALPAVADAVENTLYLVPNSGSGTNVKDEYLFANGAYELMGTTEVDLSGYYTASEIDTGFTNMFNNASITVLGA